MDLAVQTPAAVTPKIARRATATRLTARWRSALILGTVALAGCAASPIPADPAVGSPDRSGYRASGNEPFWALVFAETTMQFTTLGSPDTVIVTRPRADSVEGGWVFTATDDTQPVIARIEDRRCSDTMSGRPFPHTVAVTVSGQTFTGCGGDTAGLITGEEWRVSELEGTEITGRQHLTLLFADDGVLTGDGGCNRFRASYEVTGEGFEIGPVTATRRGCVEPEANAQEARFFRLLEQVTRFDIAADGGLELIALDWPVIVARR